MAIAFYLVAPAKMADTKRCFHLALPCFTKQAPHYDVVGARLQERLPACNAAPGAPVDARAGSQLVCRPCLLLSAGWLHLPYDLTNHMSGRERWHCKSDPLPSNVHAL